MGKFNLCGPTTYEGTVQRTILETDIMTRTEMDGY